MFRVNLATGISMHKFPDCKISHWKFVKLTIKTYVVHTIVIIQSWFCPRTLAHLQ